MVSKTPHSWSLPMFVVQPSAWCVSPPLGCSAAWWDSWPPNEWKENQAQLGGGGGEVRALMESIYTIHSLPTHGVLEAQPSCL